MNPSEEVRYLLQARFHLLWIVTGEERRAENAVCEVAEEIGYNVRFWDCATGVTDASGGVVEIPQEHTEGIPPNMPQAIWGAIKHRQGPELWILRDLHAFFHDPGVVRGLKSTARELQNCDALSNLTSIVLLSNSSEIPSELQNSVTMLEWPLPTKEDLEDYLEGSKEDLNDVIEEASGGEHSYPEEEAPSIVDAASGLSLDDAANAISRSIVEYNQIVPGVISAYKKRVVERERVLQWYEPDPRGLDAIGGLDLLKDWLRERKLALSEEAREYGLPVPKGLLLVGQPGNGKSLTAKTLPTAWGIPLLRLDLGALKSKYVGASEQNIRKALRVAEAVAPVVLWLDEVEKALAGSQGHQGDGGVSADALGTILTWLQEHKGLVFLVATSNDATRLPAEFSRKGRFDEIFFVDFPHKVERQEILAVTLRKFKRDPGDFDLEVLSTATDQFSGAEIAELVPNALFRAFRDGKREPATEDLLEAAEKTNPISRTYQGKMNEIKAWSEGKARRASSKEEGGEKPKGGRFTGLKKGLN